MVATFGVIGAEELLLLEEEDTSVVAAAAAGEPICTFPHHSLFSSVHSFLLPAAAVAVATGVNGL